MEGENKMTEQQQRIKREEENKRTEHQQGIYRGYLLFWGEYQIYFIECGETQKSKFSFYFILNRKYRKHNLTFSLVVSRLI